MATAGGLERAAGGSRPLSVVRFSDQKFVRELVSLAYDFLHHHTSVVHVCIRRHRYFEPFVSSSRLLLRAV